jgi:hypothetical protein
MINCIYSIIFDFILFCNFVFALSGHKKDAKKTTIQTQFQYKKKFIEILTNKVTFYFVCWFCFVRIIVPYFSFSFTNDKKKALTKTTWMGFLFICFHLFKIIKEKLKIRNQKSQTLTKPLENL